MLTLSLNKNFIWNNKIHYWLFLCWLSLHLVAVSQCEYKVIACCLQTIDYSIDSIREVYELLNSWLRHFKIRYWLRRFSQKQNQNRSWAIALQHSFRKKNLPMTPPATPTSTPNISPRSSPRSSLIVPLRRSESFRLNNSSSFQSKRLLKRNHSTFCLYDDDALWSLPFTRICGKFIGGW